MVINSVQLLHDFNEIFSNDTVAKNKLKMVTKRIFDIFNLATDLSANETFELISSFILGTEENELISDKEAYDNYINYHLSLNEYIKGRGENPSFSRMILANMETEDFKMAFELDKKILVRLVCIDRLVNHQDFDIQKVYFESAGALINRLNHSKIDWSFLTCLLDRRVRNASSHLDFYYDIQSYMFVGKDVNNRKKTISRFSVSPEEFLMEIKPDATHIIQGFIAAGILLCLRSDKEAYKSALSMIS